MRANGLRNFLQRFLATEPEIEHIDSILSMFVARCEQQAIHWPQAVNTLTLEEYREYLHEHHMHCITLFFSWLKDEGYIVHEPVVD